MDNKWYTLKIINWNDQLYKKFFGVWLNIFNYFILFYFILFIFLSFVFFCCCCCNYFIFENFILSFWYNLFYIWFFVEFFYFCFFTMIFIFSIIAGLQCSVNFLLYSKVTQSHIYILFLTLSSICSIISD